MLLVAFTLLVLQFDVPRSILCSQLCGFELTDEPYRKERELLNHQNDSLQEANAKLDGQLQTLECKKDSLAQRLTYQLNTIHQLKQENHETIHAITHYAPDELYNFFSGANPDSTTTR